eukprot:12131083-Karenia_brevis.AAC.1
MVLFRIPQLTWQRRGTSSKDTTTGLCAPAMMSLWRTRASWLEKKDIAEWSIWVSQFREGTQPIGKVIQE